MPSELATFLKAIPAAASSPYGILAFLATILSWVVVSFRVQRHKQLLQHISQFPSPDRRKVVQAEMGTPVPPDLTPEQWIKSRVHRYYFVGFIVLAGCFMVIIIGTYIMPHPRIDATIELTPTETRPER
jgi:hypothetical protein